MTIGTLSWENDLISLAYDAIEGHLPEEQQPHENQILLDRAYRYCKELTSQHSKTFSMASSLLPMEKRRAIRALYAFCRISDDLVDHGRNDALAKLNAWRDKTIYSDPTGEDAVALAWNDTRHKYHIPWRLAEQLISGVAHDLTQSRYPTFSGLTTYCYGVACTVGLMSMHIIGYSGAEAIPYAIRLGVALQMTNILRDVGEDWQAGRLYLPQEELESFSLDENTIEIGQVTDKWRQFMRFQIDRNRQLYRESLPGVALLDRDGRFAIGAAAELYQAILVDIEQNDYDVFKRRANTSRWEKLNLLPGIWRRSKHSYT